MNEHNGSPILAQRSNKTPAGDVPDRTREAAGHRQWFSYNWSMRHRQIEHYHRVIVQSGNGRNIDLQPRERKARAT